MDLLRILLAIFAISITPLPAFSEKLSEALIKLGSLSGAVNFGSGEIVEANITFSDDGSADWEFANSSNVRCSGKMNLLFEGDATAAYKMDASNSSQGICPGSGRATLTRTGGDLTFDFVFVPDKIKDSYKKSAEGSLSTADAKVSSISDNRQLVDPSPNPCQNVEWQSQVTNFADLFACNEVKAIATLDKGAVATIVFDEVGFQNGLIFGISRQRDSYATYMLSPEKINTIDFNTALSIRTNAREARVQCAFNSSVADNIQQGVPLTVNVKLAKYVRGFQGDEIRMTCTF